MPSATACTKVSGILSNTLMKIRILSSSLFPGAEATILQAMIWLISPRQKLLKLAVLRISLPLLLRDLRSFAPPLSIQRNLSSVLFRGKLLALLLLSWLCSTEFLLLMEPSSMLLWLPWHRDQKCVPHSPSPRSLGKTLEKI